MKRKYECSYCHAKTEIEIDCEEGCDSFICSICHWPNKIQVEKFELGGGWLDEKGICHFPSTIQQIPNGLYIAAGIHALELILQIEYYPRPNLSGPAEGPSEGSKPAYWNWDPSQSIPKEVLARMTGVVLDKGLIDRIQGDYKGRGILLGESDGDIMEKGLTPQGWMDKYGSNGMAALLRQRLLSFARTQR